MTVLIMSFNMHYLDISISIYLIGLYLIERGVIKMQINASFWMSGLENQYTNAINGLVISSQT